MRATCQIAGCDNEVHGRGWCRRHYDMAKRNGGFAVLNAEAKAADLLWLMEGGVPAGEALARVGWTHQAAERWFQRRGQYDMARRIRAGVAA